jgi:hypothetical protein
VKFVSVPWHGIEQFSVFRFEAATAFLNFTTGSRHVALRLRIWWDSINESKNIAEFRVNSWFVALSDKWLPVPLPAIKACRFPGKEPGALPGSSPGRALHFHYNANVSGISNDGIGEMLNAHGDKMFSFFRGKLRRMGYSF